MSFRELLGQVRQTTLQAYQYQDVPFTRVMEALSLQHNTPVYYVYFALQNAPRVPLRLKGLEVEVVGGGFHRIYSDLAVHAVDHGEKIEILWIYNQDVFDQWRIKEMARYYLGVLEAAADGVK
jgi:non-ribosomal peptide synthetase component F